MKAIKYFLLIKILTELAEARAAYRLTITEIQYGEPRYD